MTKRGDRFIFPCEPHEPLNSTSQQIAQYRIVSKLGSGAMGVVYRATDTKLGRDVALKFPIEGVSSSPQMIEAFEHVLPP